LWHSATAATFSVTENLTRDNQNFLGSLGFTFIQNLGLSLGSGSVVLYGQKVGIVTQEKNVFFGHNKSLLRMILNSDCKFYRVISSKNTVPKQNGNISQKFFSACAYSMPTLKIEFFQFFRLQSSASASQ
jgi:hypothetical protein